MKKISKPQPQSGRKRAQEDVAASSCAHQKDIRNCKVCRPLAKIINFPQSKNASDKQRIQTLVDKISEKMNSSEKNLEKAGIIISNWISRKR